MSFILDALRKSEIERQRQNGPIIAEFPVAREDRRLPIALVTIAALLALNAAVVLYFVLRDAHAPDAAPAPLATAAPPAKGNTLPVIAAPAPQSELEAAAMPHETPLDEPAELYGEPATLPPDAPDPTLLPEAPVSRPGVTYSEALPDDAPAVEAATGLPQLAIDLHIYADNPAKRAVFINGRRYTQGAHIVEGPVVEEITREGAVLSYHGRRFLLPRL